MNASTNNQDKAKVLVFVCLFFPWDNNYVVGMLYFVSVIDAAGKPKPGILKGQTILVGDFDECKEISQTIAPDHVIEGQYCRMDVQGSINGLGQAEVIYYT